MSGFCRLPEIICPVCGSSLKVLSHCSNCSASFLSVDNTPILIDFASSVFDVEDFGGGSVSYFPAPVRSGRSRFSVRNFFRSFYSPSLGLNLKAVPVLKRLASLLRVRCESLGRKPRVLVIGCGQDGGGMSAFDDSDFAMVYTDIVPSSRVDIVCDAHSLPFASASFDCVIVQAVLEHVIQPFVCVDEIERVLCDGGYIYCETPGFQQVHGRQYDFHRFTFLGHRSMLRAFKEICSGASCGPGMALAWSLKYFLLSFVKRKSLRFFVSYLSNWLFFPLKYFDYILIDKDPSLDCSSAFYFLGSKSHSRLRDSDVIRLYRGGF